MATSFDSVIDMALIIIRDYKLDALYQEDAGSFNLVLQGYRETGMLGHVVGRIKGAKYRFDLQ